MSEKRTYTSCLTDSFSSLQKEYTKPTELLAKDGRLLSPGWARHMVFEYDANDIVKRSRFKEWEFYSISNGRYAVQVNLAKIAVGGFASAVLIDLRNPDKRKKQNAGVIVNATAFFIGSKKYILPKKCDTPSNVKFSVNCIGKADFEFDTHENYRTLSFRSKAQGKDVVCDFRMDIPDGHEGMTTVLPFKDKPTCFFMTTKQCCMPCSGTFRFGNETIEFSAQDSFCCLDWGRVNAPRKLVWFWGSGSSHLKDSAGNSHTFGFELTWGIGDESVATETCLFYDGKIHKIGAVDVEVFPKPDKYMQPWHIRSSDGRLDMVMTPFNDQHSDMNVLIMRMNCHQVHGLWNGKAVLDDGTVLEIKDMYAFCEYVENKW